MDEQRGVNPGPFSAPKLPGGLSRHEAEMLRTLLRKDRGAAVRVYLAVIRKGMDRATATAGDRRAITRRELGAFAGGAVDAALEHLRQARLVTALPARPGHFRFFLPLVDRG
jgi:hypothetical protein